MLLFIKVIIVKMMLRSIELIDPIAISNSNKFQNSLVLIEKKNSKQIYRYIKNTFYNNLNHIIYFSKLL